MRTMTYPFSLPPPPLARRLAVIPLLATTPKPRRRRRWPRVLRTAMHEAGHVVALMHFGNFPKSVTIAPTVIGDRYQADGRTYAARAFTFSPEQQGHAMRMALAGIAAEQILTGREEYRAAAHRNDMRMALDAAEWSGELDTYWASLGGTTVPYAIRRAYLDVLRLLRKLRPLLHDVAAALLRNITLDQAALLALATGAP